MFSMLMRRLIRTDELYRQSSLYQLIQSLVIQGKTFKLTLEKPYTGHEEPTERVNFEISNGMVWICDHMYHGKGMDNGVRGHMELSDRGIRRIVKVADEFGMYEDLYDQLLLIAIGTTREEIRAGCQDTGTKACS